MTTGKGENPPVNAKGALPDGRAFDGPEEFKTFMAGYADKFGEAFVEQLATFALRRVMTLDDRDAIEGIAAKAKPGEYRLRKLIEEFVMSDLFQKR